MIPLLAILAAETFCTPFVSGFVTGVVLVHKWRTSKLDAASDMVQIVEEVVEVLD